MANPTEPTDEGWPSPAVRTRIYGVTTAAVPLLVAYGVIGAQTAPLWGALVFAVFGTGTALLNRPTK